MRSRKSIHERFYPRVVRSKSKMRLGIKVIILQNIIRNIKLDGMKSRISTCVQ